MNDCHMELIDIFQKLDLFYVQEQRATEQSDPRLH
jgi:hypothetical protein